MTLKKNKKKIKKFWVITITILAQKNKISSIFFNLQKYHLWLCYILVYIKARMN